MTGINYIDYYIPETELPIGELVRQLNVERIPKNYGDRADYQAFAEAILQLQSIRVEARHSATEMLSGLLTRMFESHVVAPGNIDMIVLVREPRGTTGNNIAQELQFRFGMKNAFILNVSGNHCANIEVAIATVTHIRDADINNVLILNATITPDVNDRIIGSYGIMGDAAGVMLLGRECGVLSIKDTYVTSNGRLYEANVEQDNAMLHAKYLMKCVRGVLEKSEIKLSGIGKIVVQNGNPLLNAHVLTSAGLGVGKMYKRNLGKYGHLDSLDFLVNLKDICNDEEVKSGELILSLGMGWAGSYASLLFSKN
jgi:3-oxoacyl-[acyl-carrier-protein] synthase III